MLDKSAQHRDWHSKEHVSLAYMNNHITNVYDRHVDTIYRVCFSMTGNKQDAEDAVQSVFVKFVESEQSFSEIEHEKAWLIVTAKNTCIDLHRKWWRKKEVNIDLNIVGSEVKESFKYNELEEHINKLPSKHRLILYLYYYEGYQVKEIAKMLNMNLNTVKTRMRNARKKLKLWIGDDYNG